MDIKKSKWNWMMDYCKDKGIPPAEQWAWEKAGKAWDRRAK